MNKLHALLSRHEALMTLLYMGIEKVAPRESFLFKGKRSGGQEGVMGSLGVSGASTPGAIPHGGPNKMHIIISVLRMPGLSALLQESPTFRIPS